MSKLEKLAKIATRLRIHSLKMTTQARSGHPTTCLSMAELMACLFFDEMRFNPKDCHDWANDELVLSKGHAAPILYAAYAEAGILPLKKLETLRLVNSELEGHPTPRFPWIKAATGSLGQGLSIGVGMAWALKMGQSPARVYVLLGDGECAEGAVWEAANAARVASLDNLVAIVDVNRLGQSEATMHGHDLKAYERKFRAFGWEVFSIDGHNLEAILEALKAARKSQGPSVILAKTIKGKGVSFLEDKNGWHGRPLNQEELEKALAELGPMPQVEACHLVKSREPMKPPAFKKTFRFKRNIYQDKTATRLAYGQALLQLGQVHHGIIALDGDVKNSTYAEKFFAAFPERSFQSYIAEQNMVGMAIGLAAKGYLPFVATFAAFLTRAHDQIRMAGYSFANIKFCGSHVGVSIGEDGPSQMGMEDLALFRPIPGCVVLYPCDAPSTEACLESMARYKGMAYLRTTRPATPIIYHPNEKFPIGGVKILRRSDNDVATVIGAGITVFEALKAYEELKKENINIRVIDAYSIKPLDEETLKTQVSETKSNVVVVEDHFAWGGLGEAVALALSGRAKIIHLAVREIPRSGKPEELLDLYGLSSRHIVSAVKKFLKDDLRYCL
ncbi:MAG: transketolase [Candidatus Aminicenantes bacterium]|nr:transketolase [Candidatus Aminicenantes bacterium]